MVSMGDGAWLTEREQQVWRAYLAATTMLREHIDRQLQRESDMPQTYYEVLVSLSEAPNRTLRMSELAAASRSSRSRLSHAVNRMEKAGWVQRSGCPDDKRGSFAHLTTAGFAALKEAAPGHVAEVRKRLFDVLTPEQVDQLGDICSAIRDGLAPVCSRLAAEQDDMEDAR